MKAMSIQVTYRKGRPFAAYIYLRRRLGEKAVRTEEINEDLLVDFGQENQPLGIEVMNPEAVGMDAILGVFDTLGLSRPDPIDLGPLQAA